jgi:hypothetical protein
MKKCFQVLFNHPLQFEDGVLWGVRLPYDERSKYIIDYTVDLIGQWCFTQKHGGKIEDISKWTDRNGNIYDLVLSTRLYSYTAALDTKTYFRIDEWWVEDDCDLESGVEMTDKTEYFNTRCVLQEQDYKTGYNGWLQVYQKLVSKYQIQLSLVHTEVLLDYDEQEKMRILSAENGCRKILYRSSIA